MAMYDLTNNGQPTNAPAPVTNQEKKEPIAQGKVVKESLGEQIYKSLIPEDPKQMAKNFLLNTAIPGVKKLIFDGISNFFNLKPAQTNTYQQASYTYTYAQPPQNTYMQSGPYQVLRIQFAAYQEAVDILAALERDIQTYHIATVAAYYEYAHCGVVTRIDYAYGWRNLATAHVYESSDHNGYFIDLPPVARVG